MKGKGAKYTVMEEDLTLGGEHPLHYTDDVLQDCTLETYIILLTNVTLINLIKIHSTKNKITINHLKILRK